MSAKRFVSRRCQCWKGRQLLVYIMLVFYAGNTLMGVIAVARSCKVGGMVGVLILSSFISSAADQV